MVKNEYPFPKIGNKIMAFTLTFPTQYYLRCPSQCNILSKRNKIQIGKEGIQLPLCEGNMNVYLQNFN